MRIYLTGYMGSGKSTVGKILAQRLHYSFIDLDDEIERQHGMSIPEIFRTHGQEKFRQWETETLTQTLPEDAVIATGGGCFIYNTAWMLQHGTVIYLELPFDEIQKRIGNEPGRPLYTPDVKLLNQRLPVYKQARHVIDANKPPQEIVEKILRDVVRASRPPF